MKAFCAPNLKPCDPAHVDTHYDSPGGHTRIWWAQSGDHAPPLTDADADGIPDFVNRIARTSDAVITWLTDNGWRIALDDQDLNDGTGFGGDNRFDIYLEDFRAGDGHRVVEACRDLANGVRHCAGYFVMENDFVGSNYPSLDEAVSVLVSHEYFHTVQDAYQSEIPTWWSEGSATWFEEVFDPSQSDFEGLARLYFDESNRSILGYIRGPSDGFSYGTSLFVYFIGLHIGHEGVRGIFEQLDQGTPLIDAISAQTKPQFQDLGALFRTFAVWNVLTASRAVTGFGYPQASSWSGLKLTGLNTAQPFFWDRQIDAWAADYAILNVERPARVALQAVDGWPDVIDLMVVQVRDKSAPEGVQITHLTPAQTEGVLLEVGVTTYLIPVNSLVNAKAAGRVALSHEITEPVDPDPNPDTSGTTPTDTTNTTNSSDDGCQISRRFPHSEHGAGAAWAVWLSLSAAAASLWIARKRSPSTEH
jgi:hypothetical protein